MVRFYNNLFLNRRTKKVSVLFLAPFLFKKLKNQDTCLKPQDKNTATRCELVKRSSRMEMPPVKCAWCGKMKAVPSMVFSSMYTKEVLKRCGRCLGAFYCTAVCQSEDWGHHKKECRVPYLGKRETFAVAIDVRAEDCTSELSCVSPADLVLKVIDENRLFLLPQFRSSVLLVFQTIPLEIDVIWSTHKGLAMLTIAPSSGTGDLSEGLPLRPGRWHFTVKQGASRRILRENPLKVVARHS